MTELPSIRIGIIGAGRAGCAVGSAWRSVGHDVVGINAHSEDSAERAALLLPGVPLMAEVDLVREAEVVVLAVPDAAIATVAKSLDWRPGQTVIHLSGATSIHALDAAAVKGAITMSLHPAMTFTGTSLDVARIEGTPIAVTAPALYLPVAHALATALGGKPFDLADEDKPAYHAALSHAANHLVTLISQSRTILEAIGVAESGEVLRPLTQAALEGALTSGWQALTGPVARGDWETVARHEEALSFLEEATVQTSGIKATYQALSQATREGMAQLNDAASDN